MGDKIGSGSVTGSLLRLFSDFKSQTEPHYVGWLENNNKRNPNRCHQPLITQLFQNICFDFRSLCLLPRLGASSAGRRASAHAAHPRPGRFIGQVPLIEL